MVKQIFISNSNKVAFVDNLYYPLVSGYRWATNSAGYVVACTSLANSRAGPPLPRIILLHRLILGMYDSLDCRHVDHINHNPLDNRRSNLRKATPGQNGANSRKLCSATSQYKGVSSAPRKGTWRAQIAIDGHARHLGIYDTEKDAALAYDIAAVEAWGEFACLNFPYDPNAIAPKRAAPAKWGTSEFRGVSWHKHSQNWQSCIRHNGKLYHLGRFCDEEDAARAFDKAAIRLRGPNTYLNFPTEA